MHKLVLVDRCKAKIPTDLPSWVHYSCRPLNTKLPLPKGLDMDITGGGRVCEPGVYNGLQNSKDIAW